MIVDYGRSSKKNYSKSKKASQHQSEDNFLFEDEYEKVLKKVLKF